MYGVNDVYDYTSDLHNPRKQGQSLEGTILSPVHHRFVLSAARYCTALVFVSSLSPILLLPKGLPKIRYLQGPIIATLLLAFSWQYSSLPLRLKEMPFLDSISNGSIVWLSWALGFVTGGNALLGRGTSPNAKKGWILGLCTSGVHAIGAAADVQVDAAAGQRTIATEFGPRAAVLFCTFC